MRRYESISIIDSEVSPEDRDTLFERLDEIISRHKGLLVNFDEWGNRKLAYGIKNKSRGYYVRLDYCGDGEVVQELERFFRIDDRVLKYLTVLLAKNVDMDRIIEEKERLAAEKIKDSEKKPTEEQEISEVSVESGEAPESAETEQPDEEKTGESEPEPENTETEEK